MRAVLVALVVSALAPVCAWAAPPPNPPPPPSATLAACNTSGSRPITGSLTFTLVAPAGAGGSQSFSVPVGSCSPAVFYPQGTAVSVTETVPSGYAVTSITIGGGGSTISANSPAAGTASVTIGSGASVITFTTSGPASPCKVPLVVGVTLLKAKMAIRSHACAVGHIRRAYSSNVRRGHVISQKPRRGTVLAHAAPVDLLVSLGHR